MHKLDRITSLPDCLLRHILSLLPTKEFIRTSILSKRWINVWKSVPLLDLNDSDFPQVEDFKNFANFIFGNKLFPYPERLDTFNLTWQDCSDDESHIHTIKTWLSNLASLKPRVVNIKLFNLDDIDTDICFDPYLLNFSNLESLFLCAQLDYDCCWTYINAKPINLPNFKILNLESLFFTDEFVQRLMLGCPTLEELFLENCYFNVTERISSCSVRKLVMTDCVYTKWSMLRICMPSLEYLSCGVRLNGLSFENLRSLEYASVKLLGMHNEYIGKGKGFALRGLSNAKSLQLSGLCVRLMLEMEALNLPCFEKLEILELCGFVIKDFEPIASFFRHIPNLRKLTLRNISMIEERAILQWGWLDEIRCGNLKTLEIVSFSPDEEANELVNYLLVHLKAVENNSINGNDPILY